MFLLSISLLSNGHAIAQAIRNVALSHHGEYKTLMPCNDVTEQVQIELCPRDTLVEYALAKATCGAPVGKSSILDRLRGLTVDHILASSLLDVIPDLYKRNSLQQFMLSKQLFALQEALAVYTGNSTGSPTDIFTLGTIDHTPNATTLTGFIKVDLITERIKACTNCCTTRTSSTKSVTHTVENGIA